jgi:hypothetical protein
VKLPSASYSQQAGEDHPFEPPRSSFSRMCDGSICSTLLSMTTLSHSSEPSDAVLLARVARGDTGAYELIYKRYHRQASRPAL